MRRAWLHSGTPAVRLWSAAILVVCAPIGVRGQEPFPGLEAYVAKAINDWHIPGLGIAIVRNDSVLYAKGFGVLSAGSRTPVNEHT